MKIFLVILILFSIISIPVSASEIIGSISTQINNQNVVGDGASEFANEAGQGEVDPPVAVIKNNTSVYNGGRIIASKQSQNISAVKVLGFSAYPDNTLLRDSCGRIYIIQHQYKKYIHNLRELQNYSGQNIYEVSDDYLQQYQDRQYFSGELIREVGQKKIFFITKGKLKHILNLTELRKNFFGQEIFNVSHQEMQKYF